MAAHFDGKAPVVRQVYDRLMAALQQFGPVVEEPKKTSIHLVNKSGFAGVHTRKGYINLEFKADRAVESPRIAKSEQVSRNRFHHLVRLESADDVDAELLAWLKEAYELSG
ncbi:MAG TPA: DUF5655 domain-containing protein [Ardenticatenaceae bacterium]|nr:DUF5655 domain-containing protein [Ardenticatenaceae bacterium]